MPLPVVKPASRPLSRTAATVSASVLAQHLDCSRTYVGKLEAEGVIQRQGGGFPLDGSRVAYLRYLRRERRQSPRSEADADFQRAKSELIRLRIAEKQRELVQQTDVDALIDSLFGVLLPALSSLPAQCAGRDMAMRRNIEKAVFKLRTDLAAAAQRRADECGEPALDEQ